MAATERVVVLMTAEQKRSIAEQARAEGASIADYTRRQALGDELLREALTEIERSLAETNMRLDSILTRLDQALRDRSVREEEARKTAMSEFDDIDFEQLAQLLVGSPNSKKRRAS